jgi:hypothetical protein
VSSDTLSNPGKLLWSIVIVLDILAVRNKNLRYPRLLALGCVGTRSSGKRRKSWILFANMLRQSMWLLINSMLCSMSCERHMPGPPGLFEFTRSGSA